MTAPGLSDVVNLLELEVAAQQRLQRMYFDYYAAGANDEITLRENAAAYSEMRLAPRVLVDVGRRDTSVTLLGKRFEWPILVAPMAFQRLAHPEGEVATARAASAAQMGMVLSTFSTSPISEVRSATSMPLWFQLYVYKDRGATRALVQRVEEEGCEALVFTVDAPLIGRRERDVRNRLHLPSDLRVVNALSLTEHGNVAELPESGLAHYITEMIDPSITWDDIAWIRSITRLPIVVKGVQRGDDAARAVHAGVDALVVSNHGGRQLDTARATAHALPEVVDAVAGQVAVLIDGGIRRGTDVVKALALGADAVLVGRPILWGLVLGGESGVARVLSLLRDELDLAMALCGAADVPSITRDLLVEW